MGVVSIWQIASHLWSILLILASGLAACFTGDWAAGQVGRGVGLVAYTVGGLFEIIGSWGALAWANARV